MDKLYKAIPFLIAVVGIFSCQQWIEIPVTNQYLDWLCQFAILGIFVWMAFRSRKMPQYALPWQIALYLVMVLLSAVYGIFMSEGYWDYKALVTNFLAYSLAVGYPYFAQPTKVAASLKVWLLVAAVTVWFLLPFMDGECGKYLLPLSFLLVFISLLEKKTMLAVLVLSLVVVFFGSIGDRSTLLRFIACFLIGLGVMTRRYLPRELLLSVVVLELILPFVLLALGVTGVFNVFQIGEAIGASKVEVVDSNDGVDDFGADTRTFIYIEEAASAVKHNYFIQGRSLARGYDSDFFMMADDEMAGRGERGSSEVSILNFFNYFGLIGVAVFFAVIAGAIVHAFKHSRSKILLFVAVYLGFRWCYSFVEDYNYFNLNTICQWIAVSMCYSPFFNRMTDSQFVHWARKALSF
ncbi:MAG: hypothetical protein ACI399_02375 [Candidatus Cryptobacteroides sp.]